MRRFLDRINVDLDMVGAIVVSAAIASAAILPFWAMR